MSAGHEGAPLRIKDRSFTNTGISLISMIFDMFLIIGPLMEATSDVVSATFEGEEVLFEHGH